MNHKDTASPVDEFHVNGVIFTHKIFCSDDDRIECRNEFGDLILTFTANCYVLDATGKQIGYLSMSRNDYWYLEYADGKRLASETRDLLKFEVEVAKKFIRGELK